MVGEDRRHARARHPLRPAWGELRRLARREPDRRATLRLLAIADAVEGLPRAEAAWLAGMERPALRGAGGPLQRRRA